MQSETGEDSAEKEGPSEHMSIIAYHHPDS